jgi:serine/threonine-protein kinase
MGAPKAQLSLRPGDHFGRFQLLERIGKGGMAEVFSAVAHGVPGFERSFVVKRIRLDTADSPKFAQMFCEEARISALLRHPNIVQIYDFGHIDGAYFMAMEHLHGNNLSSVMGALRARDRAMPPALAVFIAREAARALHHAHTLTLPDGTRGGIVHRDVTPSNIMLLKAGGVKILDFGLAKAEALARFEGGAGKKPGLAGKLAYMSPELVRGTPIDHRSDIFSLGVVLWEMVAGQRLFAADDEPNTLRNVLAQPIAQPSRRRDGVPAMLDTIIARALERDRAQRYETAQAFADDLDRLLAEMPIADQEIPRLLAELSSAAPSLRNDAGESGSATSFSGGTASGPAAAPPSPPVARTGAHHGRVMYHTIPPLQPPRVSLLTLIGIFSLVVAVVVTVGRLVVRHQMAGDQSSSARSVSTSK